MCGDSAFCFYAQAPGLRLGVPGTLILVPTNLRRAGPQVCRGLEWWRAAHPDLLPRCTFAVGDIFDPAGVPAPPPGAKRAAYVLRNILHNWGDGDALRILR